MNNDLNNDLISVLIPAYNVEKYIARCLRSVIRQTYQNLEIVVVDDGSKDNTYAIAQKFAAEDPRIVLLQKPNEACIAKTRNFLFDHLHGKYCVFVESDDHVKPRFVERLYQAITANQADVSVCEYGLRAFPWPMLPPLRRRTTIYDGKSAIPRLAFKGMGRFMMWNKMYRADIIKGTTEDNKVYCDTDVGFGEDWLYCLRYLERCQKVAWINDKLYYYSWRAGSEMHQKFSDKRVSFVNKLLTLCEQEPDPVVNDTLRTWTAFTCCGFVFQADKKRYPEMVARMKHYAHEYRQNLFKNRFVMPFLKMIQWLGLRTWCRVKRERTKK